MSKKNWAKPDWRYALGLARSEPFIILNLFFDGMQEDSDGYDPSVLLTNIDIASEMDLLEFVFDDVAKLTAVDLGVSLNEIDIPLWATVAFTLRWKAGQYETDGEDGRLYMAEPPGWEIVKMDLLGVDLAPADDHNEEDWP